MKPTLYTLFAAAAACGLASAAETSYSLPVGVVTLGDPAQAPAVAANTDSSIGLPLSLPKAYQGASDATATATTVTLKGTPGWAVDEWAGDAANPYAAVVVSGAESGAMGLITTNSADTLTVTAVEGDFSSIAEDDSVAIIPCWTLKKFIDPTSVPPGTQLLGWDGAQSGVNLSANLAWVSSGAAWIQTIGGPGGDNSILYPGEAFILRTGPTPVATLDVVGEVQDFNHRVTLAKNSTVGTGQDIRFSYYGAVGDGLLASGLGANPGDQVLIIDNTATGINKSPAQSAVFSGAGWIGTGGGLTGPQDTYELESGKGYIYRIASTAAAGTRDWSDEQSYIPSL